MNGHGIPEVSSNGAFSSEVYLDYNMFFCSEAAQKLTILISEYLSDWSPTFNLQNPLNLILNYHVHSVHVLSEKRKKGSIKKHFYKCTLKITETGLPIPGHKELV